MANGSTKAGPAKADRLREKYARLERHTQRAMDELPPYREEMDSSEVTVNTKGLHAKGVPRWALGIALVLASLPASVWIVVKLVQLLR